MALLVENRTGYQNLCLLITRYKLQEQDKGTGTATLEEVAEHAEGLVCLTGGGEGILAACLAHEGYEEARRNIERLVAIFGKRSVYVEVQRHFDPVEEVRNQAAVRIAETLNLPLLVTNGVRYAHSHDREILDVFTCIRNHCQLDYWSETTSAISALRQRWLSCFPICRRRLQTPENFRRGSNTHLPI